MFRNILLIVCALIPLCVSAQLTVQPGNTPPYDPEAIINNVFLGSGVEIQSVDYLGAEGSVGIFENGLDVIGIDRGIVLSTGWINAIPKPSGDNSEKLTSGTEFTDDDLSAIMGANVSLNDVAKYEITFVPTSDTLKFRYVFASEEYTEFQCRLTNDGFGFFIKGPNPSGGDYLYENMALIPGTNLPVSVNTVNNGIDPTGNPNSACQGALGSLNYSHFYNDNESDPTNQPIFDGYIDVFTAVAAVIPCESYTIKIVIADGLDGENDSAVFLEEKSFSTGTLEIDVDNPGLDGGISEGCSPGNINLGLPRPTLEDFPIEINVLSDPALPNVALPGIDFIDLESNIFIPAGSSSVDLPLSPIDDSEEEGIEYIYLEIRRDICNLDTLIVPIFDNSLDFVTLPDSVFTCKGRGVSIEASLGTEINISDITRFNTDIIFETNAQDTSIAAPLSVTGLPQQFLDAEMIAEVCIESLKHQRLNDLDIFIESPSGQILELSTDNGARPDNDAQEDEFINTCFTVNAGNNIHLGNPDEGTMNLANPNYTGNYAPEGDWSTWLSPVRSLSNGTYKLIITDDQSGAFTGTLSGWSIAFNPIYNIQYEWTPKTNISCTDCIATSVVLEESQYYYLELTDSYNCTSLDSVWVNVYDEPEKPVATCEGISTNAVQITWTDVDADDYQIMINGMFPWINTKDANIYTLFGYTIETSPANVVVISGLLPEEEIEVVIRGINEARGAIVENCFSPQDTLMTCVSFPCADTAPVIDDIIIDQPACEDQGGVEVQVIASDPNQPLNYYVYTDNAIFEKADGLFLNLAQGDWPLKVEDNSGCITLDTIRIDDPPPIEIIETITNVSCTDGRNGEISLEIGSDDPPYSFEWAHTTVTTNAITDLTADTYFVTVTDGKGCTQVDSFVIINPDPISYDYIQIEPIDCLGLEDGSATLMIEGGKEPYSIEWNDGTVADTVENLKLGFAVFTITDDYGCVILDSAIVEQNSDFQVSSLDSELECFTDSTATSIISAAGGEEPYAYEWDNGQETEMGTGLHAGSNYVTITDDEGCVVIYEADILSPPEIEVDFIMTPTTCFGSSDGRLEIDIEGGVGSLYRIEWFDGTTIDRVSNLSSGIYCVKVTDETDCETEVCFEVEDTPQIAIQETITKANCVTDCTGGIQLNAGGGSGNFFYNWSGPDNFGSNTKDLVDLCVGDYTVTITEQNDNNCSEVFNLTVEPASALEPVMLINKFISCNGNNDGEIQVVAVGGVGPFNYEWSPNVILPQDSVAQNLQTGIYNVTITDDNGCSNAASLELSEPDAIEAEFENEDVLCFGGSNGVINMTVSGGTPIASTGDAYLVEWEDGSNDSLLTELEAGIYVVSITDKNGCEAIEQTRINQPEEEILIDLDITEVSCFGGRDGIVRLDVLNAARPISYSLDNIEFKFDSTFLSLTAGEYTAYIRDANGCEQTQTFYLNEGEELDVDLGDDIWVDLGTSTILNTIVTNNQGDITYSWNAPNISNFSCLDCPNPEIVNVIGTFSVTVTVEDSEGCTGKDFITVIPIEDRAIAVPTGFSPNNDNINDRLVVFGGEEININKFTIFDRWGEIVYENFNFSPNDESQGWDGNINGKPAPQTSYVWTAEFSLQSGKINFEKGQTTLIR